MNKTIYIIGNNALAYYLGAQIQSSGQDVVMLLDRKSAAESLATDGISLKEDRSLTQKRHKLNASTFMKEPAEMVIIADYANRINSALSNVSNAKIDNAPVVCFTPLKNLDYLIPLVGNNIHPAYFNGYVTTNKNSVLLMGRNTSVTLCPPQNGEIDPRITELFSKSHIQTVSKGNSLLGFWEYFAPYALCSLLSAAADCKISEMLKDKNKKDMICLLVDEFCSLAKADNIVLRSDAIMKTIFNTPTNYVYPLHQSIISGGKDEFNLMSSIITKAALSAEISIPETDYLLKRLYKRILNPIL